VRGRYIALLRMWRTVLHFMGVYLSVAVLASFAVLGPVEHRSPLTGLLVLVIALPVTALGKWLVDSAALKVRARFSWPGLLYLVGSCLLLALCTVLIFDWTQMWTRM